MPYVDRMQKVQSKQINAVKKGCRNIQRVNHNVNIKKNSTCIFHKLYHCTLIGTKFSCSHKRTGGEGLSAKDSMAKEYFADNARFADLCNNVLYGGREVILPENLKERDTTEVLTALGLDKKTIAMQKMRDIFKNASIKYTGKSYVVLIGVENQSDIHYAIPVKNMFYDVMAYGNQVKETAKKHRKEKDTATSDEFLSGFTKEDKLIPVITITVYLGTKEWDGPRRLSDMFGEVDEELLPFIPDYRINLLAPREITDFTRFRTSIRQLFEVLKNAYDKEKMQEVLQNDEKFSKVDRETVEAINLFAGTDIDIDEKEEVIDMCKAWEEQKNEGRELGERQKIISQIVKKLQKDKSVAEIADDLEEKEEVIAPIYEAALSMKPDYDVEKIYELLEKNKKLA